jgi:hypothetical protein
LPEKSFFGEDIEGQFQNLIRLLPVKDQTGIFGIVKIIHHFGTEQDRINQEKQAG